jgi:hypothetical protein
LFQQRAVTTGYVIRYEIVVQGKVGREKKEYEITFSETGELLKSSEIILRNTDNLAY